MVQWKETPYQDEAECRGLLRSDLCHSQLWGSEHVINFSEPRSPNPYNEDMKGNYDLLQFSNAIISDQLHTLHG